MYDLNIFETNMFKTKEEVEIYKCLQLMFEFSRFKRHRVNQSLSLMSPLKNETCNNLAFKIILKLSSKGK